ncbi:MAG: hypothetical protein V9G12_13350 [Microthrixaceae bacterium]
MADEQISSGTLGPNTWLVDEMYEQYLANPHSVSVTWQEFFADYRPPGPGPSGVTTNGVPPANGAAPAAPPTPAAASAPATPAAPAAVEPPAAPPAVPGDPIRGVRQEDRREHGEVALGPDRDELP